MHIVFVFVFLYLNLYTLYCYIDNHQLCAQGQLKAGAAARCLFHLGKRAQVLIWHDAYDDDDNQDDHIDDTDNDGALQFFWSGRPQLPPSPPDIQVWPGDYHDDDDDDFYDDDDGDQGCRTR